MSYFGPSQAVFACSLPSTFSPIRLNSTNTACALTAIRDGKPVPCQVENQDLGDNFPTINVNGSFWIDDDVEARNHFEPRGSREILRHITPMKHSGTIVTVWANSRDGVLPSRIVDMFFAPSKKSFDFSKSKEDQFDINALLQESHGFIPENESSASASGDGIDEVLNATRFEIKETEATNIYSSTIATSSTSIRAKKLTSTFPSYLLTTYFGPAPSTFPCSFPSPPCLKISAVDRTLTAINTFLADLDLGDRFRALSNHSTQSNNMCYPKGTKEALLWAMELGRFMSPTVSAGGFVTEVEICTDATDGDGDEVKMQKEVGKTEGAFEHSEASGITVESSTRGQRRKNLPFEKTLHGIFSSHLDLHGNYEEALEEKYDSGYSSEGSSTSSSRVDLGPNDESDDNVLALSEVENGNCVAAHDKEEIDSKVIFADNDVLKARIEELFGSEDVEDDWAVACIKAFSSTTETLPPAFSSDSFESSLNKDATTSTAITSACEDEVGSKGLLVDDLTLKAKPEELFSNEDEENNWAALSTESLNKIRAASSTALPRISGSSGSLGCLSAHDENHIHGKMLLADNETLMVKLEEIFSKNDNKEDNSVYAPTDHEISLVKKEQIQNVKENKHQVLLTSTTAMNARFNEVFPDDEEAYEIDTINELAFPSTDIVDASLSSLASSSTIDLATNISLSPKEREDLRGQSYSIRYGYSGDEMVSTIIRSAASIKKEETKNSAIYPKPNYSCSGYDYNLNPLGFPGINPLLERARKEENGLVPSFPKPSTLFMRSVHWIHGGSPLRWSLQEWEAWREEEEMDEVRVIVRDE